MTDEEAKTEIVSDLELRIKVLEATIAAMCDALTHETSTRCDYTQLRHKTEQGIRDAAFAEADKDGK